MKVCSKCGMGKPVEEFSRDKSAKSGRTSRCKECRKEHYRQNREHALKQAKQWSEDNREHKLEYRKTRYQSLSPFERAIYVMANGVCGRTGENGVYNSKGIKNYLGNNPQVKAFLRENFGSDIRRLLDRGLTPSIDRINPNSHYMEGNIRVIDKNENARLGSEVANRLASKSVIAIKDGEQRIFESISECARGLGINDSTVRHHLKNGTTCRVGFSFVNAD